MSQSSQTASRPVEIGPLLDHGPWGGYQKLVLFMTALAVILDGFDNQVLGFAIPAIVKEWGVTRQDFAPIFAIGFLGMSLGTALGGMLGDRAGRRTALIAAVALFGVSTLASAFAPNLVWLGVLRTISGFGLGAAMPNATTLIAEFSPTRRRSLAVTLGIVCIPLGGLVGGLVAAHTLPSLGWRALFIMGGIAPIILTGVLAVWLPESPRFLAGRPVRAGELDKVMARMGHAHGGAGFSDHGEADGVKVARVSFGQLFDKAFRLDTVALWGAFFFCILSTYVVFSWAPSMLSASGFDLAVSSNGLAAFNLGGVLGAVAGAWAILRYGSRVSMLAMAAGAVISCGLLAMTPLDAGHGVTRLMAELFVAGAFINGVQTTLYALAAQVYPASVRATGVGATAAVGRLGAIVSSFVGAAVVSTGGAAYFGAIALTMTFTLVSLAAIRRHAPRALAA
ncbi:MFS transporter [Caulobacter hibisci]|uniref:MFS transporter n=1 Tax=Caulobacter hibisci TaxID=2035993 RepID=A0ABS0T5B3_9CAUL|nr:MFS transporter [Caulobacter hibisci]MBI1686047.1 MFS transporter [Caulobacter hibisci]